MEFVLQFSLDTNNQISYHILYSIRESDICSPLSKELANELITKNEDEYDIYSCRSKEQYCKEFVKINSQECTEIIETYGEEFFIEYDANNNLELMGEVLID